MTNLTSILAVVFLVLPACTKHPVENEQDKNELIPRSQLFSDQQRTNFQLSPNGKHVYYQHGGKIKYLSTNDTSNKGTLGFKKPILSWQPANDGILAITKDSTRNRLARITNNGVAQYLEVPSGTRQLAIMDHSTSKPDFWAIKIISSNKNQSGIYKFNVSDNSYNKISDIPSLQSVHFDGRLNPVAGNTINNKGEIVISYYNKQQEKWMPISVHPWDESVFLGGFQQVLSVSDNGNYIYYTSNLNTDKTHLKSFHVPSQKTKTLARDSLVDMLPFGFSTNSQGHVTSVVGLFAKTIRKVVDEDVKGDFKFLSKQIEGDIGFVETSYDDQKWLIREFNGGPTNYYLYNRDSKEVQYLMNDFPPLNGYALANRQAHSVKTRDGLQLPLHVYLPPGSDQNQDGIPDEPLPTVLYVHGGPWVGVVHWNRHFFTRNFQLLANRGYAVINCEFRGSTGYGKEFIDKSTKEYGKALLQDKIDIANWAVENKIAQPERMGIWGWSYGGYASMAALTFAPEKFQCGLSMYGISDLVSISKRPYYNTNVWRNRVGNVNDTAERQLLKKQSPINAVQNMEAPLLMTVGSKDSIIPKSQMNRMAEKISKHGKEAIYFYYPEEGHDYSKPNSWTSFWAISEQFLAKNLGGKYEPTGNDLNCGNYVVKEGCGFIEKLE